MYAVFSCEVDAENCDTNLLNVMYMETPNPEETLIEGLATSKQGGNANLLEEKANSFDLGEDNSAKPHSPPVSENVDLSSHADVHMKGISLFVELTGDLEHGSSKGNNQSEIVDAYKHCGVNVGDLVWAMIRKQTWWPGIVCEASSVQIRENGILVRCFGNGNYIWCHPDELKTFIQHFEQLLSLSSNQRRSKMFFSAIDEALSEVGNRVKKEFTCSCFSKVVEKRVDNHDISLTRFDPATFFDYVKDLARDVSSVNKIDYEINKSILSAFNRSLGHCQIPIHQLKSPSKIKIEDESGFEGSFGKSEKGNETRERRKSRYLSYPGEQGMKELKKDGNGIGNGGMELNKINGGITGMELKKSKKKYSKKVVKQVLQLPTNVCSSEVLSELQSAAQDCVFPFQSKNFDSIERFVSGFRKWVFRDSTNGITQTPESEKPKKVRKKKNKSGSSLILDFQNSNSVVHERQLMPTELTKPPLRNLLPKKSLNNMDNNTPIQPWNSIPTPMPNVNGHMDMTMNMNMVPFLFHQMEGSNQGTFEFGSTQPWLVNHGQPPVKVNHEPKKRGRKRKHVEIQIQPQTNNGLTTLTPGLTENGNKNKRGKKGKKKEETGVPCIDLTYKKVNQETTEELKGTAFLLKFSPNYPLPSTQVLNLVFSKYGSLQESETFISIENSSGQVVFQDSSSAGGAFWGLQNDQPFGPALVNYRIQHLNNTECIEFKTPIKPHVSKPQVSKPQGQDGNFDTHTPGVIGSYMIPDLNGNVAEIKSKKTEEIRLPSMELSYSSNKVTKSQNCDNDVSGTALLLKFSPRHRVPTVQDLNTVFCKYGLNESETLVNCGQDLSGQVVFVNPLRVGEAVENLEKERPFGDSVVSFRVQHLYNVKPAIPLAVKKPVQLGQRQGQGIGVIRKNLEMMRCMLEKGGGGLSREMKEKLESEIRGLMNKVSGMDH
ncbi:hypothetical protein LXL04_030719 [Taraxacum kok-saghyz]